jgi:hypothetical protein
MSINDYYETIREKYKDLWKIKADSYGELKIDDPIVFFLDGKDVTKNHREYSMFGKSNFTEMMMVYGAELIEEINADAVIYASIDEITFVFKNPIQLINYFQVETNRSCLEALFIQKFVEKFWKYKKAYFKCTAFNVSDKDVDRLVSFRKEVGDNVGLMYLIKEKIPKSIYHGKSRIELEKLLITSGLSEYCKENNYIREGYYKEYHKRKPNFLEDSISDFVF